MKQLDPARIRKGKMRLYICLGLLVVANLVGMAINLTQNGLGSTERLLLSRTALIIVASLGVLRGSQPILRVLQLLLVVGALGSAYLLTQGRAGLAEYSIFIPDIVLGLVVAALLQFDPLVAEFLAYQRSLNFGERVSVGADEEGNSASSAQKPKAKQEKDYWDSIDDLYEEEEI